MRKINLSTWLFSILLGMLVAGVSASVQEPDQSPTSITWFVETADEQGLAGLTASPKPSSNFAHPRQTDPHYDISQVTKAFFDYPVTAGPLRSVPIPRAWNLTVGTHKKHRLGGWKDANMMYRGELTHLI